MRTIAVLSLHADPSTTVGSLQNGGVTIYVRELARAFARNVYDVDVFTRRTSPLQPREVTIDGYRLIRLEAGPARELDNDSIAAYLDDALREMRAYTRGRSYDLLSSHYWLSGYVGEHLARERNIPHVHTLHSHGTARAQRDDVTRRRIAIERDLLRNAHIVTLSTEHRETFVRDYGVMPPRLAVVPGGIDTRRFQPGSQREARERLGLKHDARYIGYIGRLAPEKGIDELIASFALLRAGGSNGRLFVVGGAARNSRVGELHSFAARFGVEHAVDFVGPVPNDAVADAFRAANVIAVPSHYEAFGLVALEARACGIPVVASDVGGLRELVTERTGGARVPASDPIAWARALDEALREPENAKRTLRACGSGVASYSWDSIAERIAAFVLADVTAA